MDKELELLRQQMELLAEKSKDADVVLLSELTHAMCEAFECLLKGTN